ncbi:hypothetical protein TIFTF001_004825 [Ficus carica]|uniref:Uncharacterized protein n=1 Tax=Ficus carica TaxID=3494 RepID=A0AA88CWP0_FICCA|nr:hypothetical protein TIFTF001_004825 [Ficus carica]
MTSSSNSGRKKRKHSKSKSKSISSGFLMFSRFFCTLTLYKRSRRFQRSRTSSQQQIIQNTRSSQSPPSPERGSPANQQISINLNEEQMKEALLSARYALHKYSAAEDTDIKFERLVSAEATFDEKEQYYSYLMTIEASDNRFYDACVLYKLDNVEMFKCFFIRHTNSCP